MCPTDFVFKWSQTELHFHFSKPIFHRTVLRSDDKGRKCDWVIKIWVTVSEMTACIQTKSNLQCLAELSKPSNKNLYKVLEGELQNLTKLRLFLTHASGNRFEGFFPLNNHTEDKFTEQKFEKTIFDLGFVTCNYNHYKNSASKTIVRTLMTI